jgi:sporulation protein YlmC with PRC-barrel domain
LEVNMNKLQMVAAVSAMTLVASAPAFAEQHYEQDKGVQGQTDPTGSRATTGQTTAQQVTPHRISKILGENVENRKGESLGEIKDIVVDSNGAIKYVAVSAGVLGIGGDLHPVPWKALRWNALHDDFMLDIDKEAFKKAPSVSSNSWPMEPSSTWSDFYRQHGISEGFGMQDGGTIGTPGIREVEEPGFQKKVVLTSPNPVREGLGSALWKW